MIIIPVKTRILLPPKDDLLGAIKESIPVLQESSIVAVTSKVISIWQGRCIAISEIEDKDKLINKELLTLQPITQIVHLLDAISSSEEIKFLYTAVPRIDVPSKEKPSA